MKKYTTQQVAEIEGITKRRVCARIKQDQSPNRRKVHYPNAEKCPCGQAWLIPEKDVKGSSK
jgi:hypothetical protein